MKIKPLPQVTYEEYQKLILNGTLKELYPKATGVWFNDTQGRSKGVDTKLYKVYNT